MTQEEFDALVGETVVHIQELLRVKGGEYAGPKDRLANFKRGAERAGVHPLQVLWIYAAKHIDSLETFIRDTAKGESRERSEPIMGRFNDLINYCILGKALVAESEVEHHRDCGIDSDRVRRVVDLDSVGGPTSLAGHPSESRNSVRDDPPVYSVVPDPGILPAAPVQQDSRMGANVAYKPGAFMCGTCDHKEKPAECHPCSICVAGDKYEHD